MKLGALARVLRKIRSAGTFWIAEQTLDHLKAIRTHELGVLLEMLPANAKVLEIGAGTGWQTQALEHHGYDVCAIDLPSSNYRENRIWPVMDYDGKSIPFGKNTFDVVFSSNALEHIPHISEFQREIHRVLKPGGVAVHVLPSSAWRLWTNLTHLLKCWSLPKAHGEHAGNALTELHYFSRRWWRRFFSETGWVVVAQKANGLFYTGHSVMDSRLPLSVRRKMSRFLGSACNVYVLREGNRDRAPAVSITHQNQQRQEC